MASADELLKLCDEHKIVADIPQVRSDKQDFVDRWEKLRLNVQEATKRIGNTHKAFEEFENRLQPVEEFIVETERKLDEDAPFSWDLLEMEDQVNQLNVIVEFSEFQIFHCGARITCQHYAIYFLSKCSVYVGLLGLGQTTISEKAGCFRLHRIF